jgi:hypothetical protein
VIYVVISVLSFCGPLVVALMWAIVALYRDGQRTRISVGDAVKEALHDASIRHAKEVEGLHEFYRASLAAIGNTVQFGTPTPQEATVDREPTPEQALGRAVEEDTIARGIESLRREYEAAGIRVTDEELRDEVIQIVLQVTPTEPASVRGLIDRVPLS